MMQESEIPFDLNHCRILTYKDFSEILMLKKLKKIKTNLRASSRMWQAGSCLLATYHHFILLDYFSSDAYKQGKGFRSGAHPLAAIYMPNI